MRNSLFAVLLCCSAGFLSAQTAGIITGEVKDPSGATAPGANVTATNTATNVARNTTTNDAGIYSFPSLTPGNYQVKVTASGFEPITRNNIELQVQQTARVDFTLTVGQASQTVEISGAADLLSTESASVGTVVEQKSIAELPLNGRDYLQLVALSPNVNYGFTAPGQAAGREGGTRASITMSLSGSRPTWNNYTLDGISNTDVNFNLYLILPSVDALQEFKVQTGIYPAEFGRDMGQVNVSTKAGTNAFHGALYEFLRNDALDARQYNFLGNNLPKAPYRQNQYGFEVGGPVWIPKVFNGRNRLFFMANWEGYKSRLSQPTTFSTIPQSYRNGDFSSVAIPLYDPNTRVQVAPGSSPLCAPAPAACFTATPFPGNQIPVSRFNAATVSLLQYDPLPNVGPVNSLSNNYQDNLLTPVNKNQFNGRIDFTENPNSQWFGRYSWTGENTLNPSLSLAGSTLLTHANQWVLSNTRVLSATKVNEARFGYSELFNQIGQQLGGVTNVDAQLGVPLPLATSDEWGIPNIGLANGLTAFGNSTNGPYTTNDKILQGVDNFSWVMGKHSIRFGGEYRYNKYPQVGNEYTRGSFTYNGFFTANPNSLAGGSGAADFLLGNLYQGSMVVSLAQDRFNSNEIAAYVDDTWKVTPKLTVTLGLRWEVEQPFYDASQTEINFKTRFPGIPNIANDPNLAEHPQLVRTGTGDFYQGINFRYVPPTVAGISNIAPIQTVRDGSLGSRMIQTDWLNFAPRVGIAYSPNSKWVVRGGFGIFYNQESKNSVYDLNRGLAGRTTNLGNYGQIAGPPNLTMQNFVSTANFPVNIAPGYLWGYQYNLPITYTEQFVANVQRQIGNSTTLEVGYNGVLDRHLYLLTNLNAPLPGITNYALRAPYPEYNLIQFLEAAGTGSYNGGSAKLTERFGSNLTAVLGYTYAKALDDSSSIRGINNDQFPENPRCLKCDYGASGFDLRHRFTGSVLYTLPFGSGQRFANHGGLVNAAVGGWQLSTIVTRQSGSPDNTTAWDSAGTLQAPTSNRLNYNGGVSPYLDHPTSGQWFNPAAFSNPLPGTYGNAGRNIVYGPSLINMDFSLIKDLRIRESQRLQFRAEFFNLLNHPNLALPNLNWVSTNQTPAASFNQITQTINANTSMRQIQFALKYIF